MRWHLFQKIISCEKCMSFIPKKRIFFFYEQSRHQATSIVLRALVKEASLEEGKVIKKQIPTEGDWRGYSLYLV